MNDDHEALLRELSKICRRTRFGEVGGIRFDLRHVTLDPASWEMPLLGEIWHTPPSRPARAPFIWFPWFGTLTPEELRDKLETEFQKQISEKYPLPREPFMEMYFPDAFAVPGDRIFIKRIDLYDSDTSLFPKEDVDFREVFLAIEKASGEIICLERPVEVNSVRSLFRGSRKDFVEVIAARMMNFFKIDSIEQLSSVVNEGNYGSLFGNSAFHMSMLIKEYFELNRRLWTEDDERLFRERMNHTRMVEEACKVGYLWGQAEAALHMKPLALASLGSRAGAAKAGRSSGERRRAKAEEGWKKLVRNCATQLRGALPEISQEDLATEIEFKLGSDAVPSHPRLVRYISELERNGLLPRRTSQPERRSG